VRCFLTSPFYIEAKNHLICEFWTSNGAIEGRVGGQTEWPDGATLKGSSTFIHSSNSQNKVFLDIYVSCESSSYVQFGQDLRLVGVRGRASHRD
jgi:hypothetical protein